MEALENRPLLVGNKNTREFGYPKVDNIPSLIQRIAKGDRPAIRECYDLYAGLIWRVAVHATPTLAKAEDMTVNIFSDVWRFAGHYNPAQCTEKTFICLISRLHTSAGLTGLRKNAIRAQSLGKSPHTDA